MEESHEFFMNPCILDSIAHRLRQEIHGNLEKIEDNCPLNNEITSEKESRNIHQSKQFEVNRVSSVIPS